MGHQPSYRTYVATFAKGGFTPRTARAQAAGNGAFTLRRRHGRPRLDREHREPRLQGQPGHRVQGARLPRSRCRTCGWTARTPRSPPT
ncbi:hypothetical protein LV779_19405 [Streptomyces thinghirensis]|nr:hypothetical protein [Streptomyces thinghirensis]